ncbi:MAG: S-methyl-5'-thioadenosine phosphorylase [Anaerolineae bacterium]|nr:S-methyl-5'-thioadenosine phosphorylase [Anaerolineae bacterium]
MTEIDLPDAPIKIAVIGGSGLYNMPEITDLETYQIDTPFGMPSADITVGTLRGKRVAFLPRHGVGHVKSPASIPQRANIYALKMLGVRFCLAINACGSLREDYAPGHIVVPDQLFDYTIGTRDRSFFEDGIVAHVSVAQPFDDVLRNIMADAIEAVGGVVHSSGTFLIEDGPRFATRAESRIFRNWGCDIIGMTTAPEAFLAREAEMAYATMAHITDYDVWHDHPVTVEMVTATFQRNITLAQQALAKAVEILDADMVTPSHSALDGAIMTSQDKMPADLIVRLKPIIGRTLGL